MRSSVRTLRVLLPFLATGALQAQDTGVLRGRVTDAASREPVVDARVTIGGTSLAATTRANGEYLFSAVPAGHHAVRAQRVGYAAARQEVDVAAGEAAELDFGLRAVAVALDAVVVSGVGAPAEKRTLGNTIDVVPGDLISGAPGATAIDQALQGKVPGAWISQNNGMPGGGISIRLRGTNSILSGGEPLWVVDGVLVDNSADALVSISANVSGARREVGGSAVTNRIADLPPDDIERIEVLKGAAAAALYGSRANNGVIQIFTKRGRAGKPRLSVSAEVGLSETPGRYELNMAPTAGWADSIFLRIPLNAPVQRYDIQDQIFRTAGSVSAQLSVSGGGEGTSYYVSGSRADVDGIVRPTNWNRTSVRARLTQAVSSKLDVTASGGYVESRQRPIPEGEQGQGLLTYIMFTPTAWNPNFNQALGQYPYNPILGPNPFAVINDLELNEDVTRFTGSLEAMLRPVPSLTVRYLFGLDDYRQETRYLQPPFLISATYPGDIQNPIRLSRQLNHDVTATHTAQVSPSVGASTTLGFRYASDRIDDVRAAASGLAPEQETVGGAVPSASQLKSEFRTVGGFLEERLGLADRLFLNAGANLEASSAFGNDQRWQFFPRLSASYVLGETDFFRNSGLGRSISTLRLRAAYGQTGGQPPTLYGRFDNYVPASHSGKPGLVASTIAGNDQLKPERQREIEGGLDLGLLDNRALLELTYYHKRTFDLVLGVPQTPSSGFQTRFDNVGELVNRGWEAALTTVNLNRPGVSWRSTLSLAHNRNRVEKLVTDADTLLFGYLNVVAEGQPIGAFWGGVWARNPDGTIAYGPVTVPVYGTVMLPLQAMDTVPGRTPLIQPVRRIVGDPNPDLIASLLNTVDLGRRVQLSVLLDGRFGNDVANFTRRIAERLGADKNVEREISGEVPPRTYTLNPAGRFLVYEEYIEDGSFVKLREIALRVRFDQAWVKQLGAETMDLRLAGRNLVTWTGYGGLDPEINLFTSNTVARGVDFVNAPLPRSFSFSVHFTF
ncbi:MAG: SusC/RagA family TonB-linked outer membrane protein [Gemmatimonadales bacterium]